MSEALKKRPRKQTADARGSGSGLPVHPENNESGKPTNSGITLQVARSGQWMEPAEMLLAARMHLNDGPGTVRGELALDLSGLEHLDASALQVLLAIRAEQHRRDGTLRLTNASGNLRKWFEYAGAAELLTGTYIGKVTAGMEESDPCARF
ncbi:MAG TPA: STAS domain-containing protein [Acidobacteriaceae bacterium]|jgi:ABC-type transporter Mla MlaB component|nr:STAS domain-containing protein [Acidobacteriaceae bacterium]